MAHKEIGFAERLQAAASAKRAQLEKLRSMTPAGETQSAERLAERAAAEERRQIRRAEHETAKRAAAAQRDVERAAEKTRQARAVADEKERKAAERLVQAEADAALKSSQKTARDAKYAARKGRQK